MLFIGIDLSGPSNRGETAVATFVADGGGDLIAHKFLLGADDYQILHFALSLQNRGNIVVGLDAPLSYNVGGGDRPADAELRRRIIKIGLRSGSVMPPTMTRMVYLTLRGISVARLLRNTNEKIKIVEVHPGAAMALRGASVNDVRTYKHNKKSRRNLLAWLERQRLKNAAAIKDPSDHYVAACAAALAAWKWHHNKAVWIHPAEQPVHPFDYAC